MVQHFDLVGLQVVEPGDGRQVAPARAVQRVGRGEQIGGREFHVKPIGRRLRGGADPGRQQLSGRIQKCFGSHGDFL